MDHWNISSYRWRLHFKLKKMNKKVYIKAIDYYLPEKVLTNDQIAEKFPEWSAVKIAKKIGISERHLSAEDETAADMAYKAAVKLLNCSELGGGRKIALILLSSTLKA